MCRDKFDTIGYSKDDNRLLRIGKNENVIGMMKNELGKITRAFFTLRAKMCFCKKINKKLKHKLRPLAFTSY